MSDGHGRFMERSGVLPTTQLFVYWKGLGTCDALLCVSQTVQSVLENGKEARIVRIDFGAAFDRVNHLGILYKLYSVGIGCSVLSILTQFLSNRSQHVMVDGCRSKLVNVLENKLIGYADDYTLMAVLPSQGVRVAVAESLIRDLGRVSEWCDLWGVKLNESKTKAMIAPRSLTMHPQPSPLTIGETLLKESDDLVILGVTFDL